MKYADTKLSEHLNRAHSFISCDLYSVTFVNGSHFKFCDFDIDVTYNGERYLHNACLVKRTSTELANNLTVDKMSLTIYCDEHDQPQGTPLMHMARNGGLDGGSLLCVRAFMDEQGQIIGAIKLFDGLVEVRSGGGMQLKIDIKSKVQLLNVGWPQRRYYPTCAFALYSKACGVKSEDYSITGRITEVKSAAEFVVRSDHGALSGGYYSGGVCSFLSGPLVGKDSTIKANTSDGLVTLLLSEEEPPKVGDVVKLIAGCDKTHGTCCSKFGNCNRDRATPFIPLKETVV